MIQINLLPVREERRKANLRQLGILLGATLVGAVALTTAYHLKLKGDVAGAKKALARTQAEIDRLKPQLEQVEHYRETKKQIERKLEVIARLDRSRSGPVHVLDELAVHSPERLWITRLSAKGETITIEGMSLDNELVALFMTALSESPYFGNVELQETRAAEVEGLKLNQFRLEAMITSPSDEGQTTAAAATGLPAGTGS